MDSSNLGFLAAILDFRYDNYIYLKICQKLAYKLRSVPNCMLVSESKVWDSVMQLSYLHPMLLSSLVITYPGPSYNQSAFSIELNHKLPYLEFKLLSS